MRERSQKKDESISSYFHDKVKLCGDANMSFEDTREQILVGLWDPNLCGPMMARVHDDVDNILHDLLKFTRIGNSRVQRINESKYKLRLEDKNGKSTNNKPSSNGTTNDATSGKREDSGVAMPKSTSSTDGAHKKSKDTKPPIKNEKGEPKCYNCDDYGHIARDSQKEKRILKCRNCNAEGHTQRHCPQKSEKPRTDKPSMNVLAEANAVGPEKMIKPVTWNDKWTFTGLVDPGSSSCTMTESAAAKCKAEVTPSTIPLYGFGDLQNPAVSPKEQVIGKINIDGVEASNVCVFVVPDGAQAVDFLIGRSFTDLPHVAYAQVDGCFQLGYRDELPFSKLQLSPQKAKLKLRTTDTTILRKHTINFVTARSNVDHSGMVATVTDEPEFGTILNMEN